MSVESRPVGNGYYWTDSMPLAAYLHRVRKGEHGIEIRSARRINGPGKFEFIFADPKKRANELAIDFANSESCVFDEGMRSIKMLLSSSKRR